MYKYEKHKYVNVQIVYPQTPNTKTIIKAYFEFIFMSLKLSA